MEETKTAPKVAVIMPAYNARATVEAAAESVLGQSFRDLELLVVDDGSTDGTGALLDRLAEKDGRLRPLRVENGGPALARNRGLEALKPGTEYVLFIDADDALAPDAVAYALAGAEGADLVFFGYTILDARGGRRDYGEPEQSLGPADLGEAFPRLYKANLLNQVWAKLFRAELLRGADGIRFQDYRWGEDRLFIFDCLERSAKVRVLPESKYCYVMRPGESLITKYYGKKFQVCLEADRRAEALAERFGAGEAPALRYMFAKSVFSCLTTLYSPSCPLTGREKRAFARQVMREERVRRRCREAGSGLPTAVLCAVLRAGSPGLTLAAFRLVALAGELSPRLFMALKHRK